MSKNKEINFHILVSEAAELGRHDHWHILFSRICEVSGHDDTYKLAHLICEKGGKSTQREIEAAARNVINWRNGSHIPHRKNFRILTEVLEIGRNQELLTTWNTLYGLAGKRARPERGPGKIADQKAPAVRWFPVGIGRFSGIVLGLFIAVAATLFYQFGLSYFSESEAKPDWQDNYIPWRKQVTLKVGEQVVVHGHRGECGKMPPDPQETEQRFTKLETGTLLVGNLGMRASRQCNSATPAREVIFLAETPGVETFIIFHDDVTVTVTK